MESGGSNAPISRVVLLSCRNVLMYFTAETQAHVLELQRIGVLDEEEFSVIILVVMLLFFDLEFSGGNFVTAGVFLLLGSVSFVGVGMMAAILPLLYVERGDQMVFVIQSIILLFSGVYYTPDTLPDWMQFVVTSKARARIRQLAAHEVGHTLGLRHNFRASTLLNADELLKDDVTEKRGQSGSVMDYNPIVIAGKNEKQGSKQ